MKTDPSAPTDPTDAESPAPAPQGTPLAFRAVRGSVWVIAGSYWTFAFGFAANILLTRLLTPEVYGVYALASFFAMLFQLRSKVGLNYAYAQERSVTGVAVGTIFSLDVALGLASVGVGIVAAPILLYFGYSADVVWIMLTLLTVGLGTGFLSVFLTTLDKELHFKPGSIIDGVALPLSYIPAIWFALNGRESLSLVSQQVTLWLLSYLFYGFFILQRMKWVLGLNWRFDKATARRYLAYGAESGIAAFVATTVVQVDNFVVGTISGTVALGYYDRGYRTAQWPNILLQALIGRSALFTYAQLKDDALRLGKTVSMVLWLIVSMAAPIALALFITAPDLILLIYGSRWLPAVPILRLLLLAALLRPIIDNAYALFVGAGRARQAMWISTMQLATILCLGWLLGSHFGPIGVGVSVIVAYFGALFVSHWLTADLLQLNIVDLFIKPLLAATIVIIGYVVLNQLLPISALPLAARVVTKGLYAVLGYYLVSFLVQPQSTLERIQYVRRLLRREAV